MKTIIFITTLLALTGCASWGSGQSKLMGPCYKVNHPEKERNMCETLGWRE